MEQLELAVKNYQKATKLDHLYHEAWYGLGICLGLQEKWYEAIHFLNKALAARCGNGIYWKAVADAEAKMGNIVSALEAYAEASEMDPENPQVWLDWSNVYYEQGDFPTSSGYRGGGTGRMP